jgi:TPR repeat protein
VLFAEHLDEEAQQMLGVLYVDGSGVTQDNEEAYFWLRLGLAKMGDAEETYAKLIGDIAENLSPSQLSIAEERVSQWILDPPPQAEEWAWGIST